MTGLRKQLQEVRGVLGEVTEALQGLTAQFGAALADSALDDEGAARELQEHLRGRKEILQELEEKQGRIQSLLSEQEEKEHSLKELKGGEKEISDRLELLHEELGRKSFEVYRRGFTDREKYGTFFARLDDLAQRKEELEADLSRLEEDREKRSFLKRISSSAKITMARGSLSGIEKEMKKYYAIAGRELLSQESPVILEEKALLPLLASCREVMRKLEDLEERESELQKEILALTNALAGLGVEKSGPKRLRELEKEQELERKRLQGVEHDYGAALLLMPRLRRDILQAPETDAARFLQEIEVLEGREEEQREQIAALEAAIGAEEKKKEIAGWNRELDSLTEKKKNLEQEIRDLKKQIQEGGEELKELQNRAGELSGPAVPKEESEGKPEEKPAALKAGTKKRSTGKGSRKDAAPGEEQHDA